MAACARTQGKSGASGHRVFGKDCDLFFKNRKYAVSLAASDAEERLKFIEFIIRFHTNEVQTAWSA